MGIQAVLFDLDNTLLDRSATFRKFSELFIEDYFPDAAASADRKHEILERMRVADNDGYTSRKDMFLELLELLPWQTKPDLTQLLDYYKIHYVQQSLLMESARELLDYCKKKYKLALVTNGTSAIQYGKIEKLQLRHYFDHILVSEEVAIKKPDERIFQLALKRLGVEASKTIFVGDHPINDIAGAASVGMRTVWIQRNQVWDASIIDVPMKAIKRLEELYEII